MISDETPFAHDGCSQILQYMPMVKCAAVDRRPVRSKYGETAPLERNRFIGSNCALAFWWSMIFSENR